MNNSITLSKMENIRQIVQDKQLKNIVIETGNENIYIPNENKFIVTKEFLKNKIEVLRGCESLETIFMEDFDFSEITTMEFWFLRCINLKEIIFPITANCQNLTNLYGCFSQVNMNIIDLSFMDFENNENFVNLNCAFCVTNARKIILPKCKVYRIDVCFCESKTLEEIVLPITIVSYDKNTFMSTFKNCNTLKLINFSKGNVETQEIVKHLNNPLTNNNIPEDCVVVLP